MGGVALFGVVGMGGVAVVGAQQQAVGAGTDALLTGDAQLFFDAGQHIGHEGALCALTAGRTDLFVVEHDPDVAAAFLFAAALQKAPQSGVGTLQVVDAAGHEILALQAHAHGLLAGAEHEVAVEDVFGPDAGLLGQHLPQGGARRTEDGLQIDLRVIVLPLVDLVVKVDAKVRDAGQRTVRMDKNALHAVLRPDKDAACHAQGTVQPGGHDHAAVALRLGAGKHGVLAAVQLLDLPGGGIAVAGRDMPAGQLPFGHPPGQHCRTVAGGVVFSAGHQLPGCAFGALLIAVGLQNGRCCCGRVKGADAFVQKIKQTL